MDLRTTSMPSCSIFGEEEQVGVQAVGVSSLTYRDNSAFIWLLCASGSANVQSSVKEAQSWPKGTAEPQRKTDDPEPTQHDVRVEPAG